MKKILYIITKSNWGGAQKYVFELVTSNIKNHYDILVLAGGNGELIQKLQEENIKIINSNIIQNTLNPIKLLQIIIKIISIIKKEKPNIVHINSSLIGLAGAIACKLTKTKCIFTAHGWPFNEKRNFLTKKILKLAMLITVILSSKTIAVSKNILDSLTEIKFIKKKMTLIYNGLKIKNNTKTPPQKLSDYSSKTHTVSIGELHPNKGHDIVIEIFKKIKNHENLIWHIIGEGEFRKKLEDKIKKLKLEDNIKLLGHISNAHQELNKYDLFLLPSRTEALGYVILEALDKSLPVIAHKIGGVPEIFDDNINTYLYTNTDELIEFLSEEKIKILIEKNKTKPNKLPKKFEFNYMIKQTMNVYKNL